MSGLFSGPPKPQPIPGPSQAELDDRAEAAAQRKRDQDDLAAQKAKNDALLAEQETKAEAEKVKIETKAKDEEIARIRGQRSRRSLFGDAGEAGYALGGKTTLG